MSVRFPTRPLDPNKGYPSLKGEPLRARTCKCGDHQLLDDDGLCACGYWPKETVDETWARQAKRSGLSGQSVARRAPGPVETFASIDFARDVRGKAA